MRDKFDNMPPSHADGKHVVDHIRENLSDYINADSKSTDGFTKSEIEEGFRKQSGTSMETVVGRQPMDRLNGDFL